jgi:hypothetical protein
MPIETLKLKQITLDVELQPREDIDRDLIATYAEAMLVADQFPPVVVFRNGSDENLLADGWHRYYAHQALKRPEIEAEVLDGDREAALRYSLQANATHGRPRSELTIKRAYMTACGAGLIDPANQEAVTAVLRVGQRAADELTREAREVRKGAVRSLALALAARGVSQRKIAERIGVPRDTIQNWLVDSRADAQSNQPDPLPSQSELDAIAAEIKAAARKEVLPDLRKELEEDLNKRLAEVRNQMEAALAAEREASRQSIAALERQLETAAEAVRKAAEASDEAARKAAQEAADQIRKELKAEQDKLAAGKKKLKADQAKLAKEDAKPLAETVEEQHERAAAERNEQMRRGVARLTGPAVDAWFKVLKSLETIDEINLEDLEQLSDPDFEAKVASQGGPAIARLQGAMTIAIERILQR